MLLVCLCTVVGLPAVGVVLIAALLIIPAVAARFWTEKLLPMVLISGTFGLVSCLVGSGLSATLPGPPGGLSRGQPTGPLIVISATFLFTVSLLFAPKRGLIYSLLERQRLRRKVARQNLLRAMYELREQREEGREWVSEAALAAMRYWGQGVLLRTLVRAQRGGLLEQQNHSYRLTDAGLSEATAVARAHRLWELYLKEHAAIAPDHVDRDADEIEHLLPPELLHSLEEKLRRRGTLPEPLPDSPHPTPGGRSR
jgi:manganese/zinc/iron transport system permease protein